MNPRSKNMYLRQSLVNMAITTTPLQRTKPKMKKQQGAIKWSDQQVLEIRALHKFGKMLPAEIAARYDMKVSAVNGLLQYVTRVFLEPNESHLPAGIK